MQTIMDLHSNGNLSMGIHFMTDNLLNRLFSSQGLSIYGNSCNMCFCLSLSLLFCRVFELLDSYLNGCCSCCTFYSCIFNFSFILILINVALCDIFYYLLFTINKKFVVKNGYNYCILMNNSFKSLIYYYFIFK